MTSKTYGFIGKGDHSRFETTGVCIRRYETLQDALAEDKLAGIIIASTHEIRLLSYDTFMEECSA